MIRFSCLLTVIISMVPPALAQSDSIIGTWKCTLNTKSNQAVAYNVWTTTYETDGTYRSKGEAYIVVGGFSEFAVMLGHDNGEFVQKENIIETLPSDRTTEYRPLKGTRLTDTRAREQLQKYLDETNEKLMTNGTMHRISKFDSASMQLVSMENSNDITNCKREGAAL